MYCLIAGTVLLASCGGDDAPVDAGAVDGGSIRDATGSGDGGTTSLDADSVTDGAPAPDAPPADAAAIDAGTIDAGAIDAGRIDAGPTDSGTTDSGPACTGVDRDQFSTGVNVNLGYNDQWQSFTPSRDGQLSEIELDYRSSNPTSLKVFEGEGAGGTLLHEQALATMNTLAVHRIVLTSTVAVRGGNLYTLQIAGINQQWNANDADPYPGGRSNRAAGTDFHFATFLTCR